MKLYHQFAIFGSNFSFLIFNESLLHTKFSFLLSILIFITSFIMLFFFSQDFFYRKNPQTLQSKGTRDYINIINLNPQQYISAWRIEDSIDNEVNVTNIFYPELTHYDYNTGELTILQTKRCSEILKKDKIVFEELKNFYCFDWNGEKFGGGIEDNTACYFSLNIYQCEHGDIENCRNLDLIQNVLSKPSYISIYYPTVNFDPENFESPFQVVYNHHYSILSPELMKVDKIKIQNIMILDDKNILFNHYTNYTFWTTSSINTDYFMFEELEQTVYTVNFYMDKDYTIYKRRYVKLQETLTVVSTFVKLNYIVFKFIALFYNRIIMYKKLAERYFSLSSLIACSNRSSKNVDTSPSQIKLNNYMNNTINVLINKKNVNKKAENIKFNKLFTIRYIFTCRRIKSSKIELYEKAKIKIDSIIDITTYIRTIMEFEFIKHNIFTENQVKRVNSLQKEVQWRNRIADIGI